MESPFDQTSKTTVCMFLEPILNTHYKTYQEVITLSTMPPGPLANVVALMHMNKLSPFQNTPIGSPSIYSFGCSHVLCRYPCKGGSFSSMKNSNNFMYSEDIPKIFSYLVSNGYTIDTSVTKMLNSSKNSLIGGMSNTTISGNKKMICMFTFI